MASLVLALASSSRSVKRRFQLITFQQPGFSGLFFHCQDHSEELQVGYSHAVFMRVDSLLKWVDHHAIRIAIGSVTLVCLLGVIGVMMVSGLNKIPEWWTQVDSFHPDNPSVIESAERLENAITTQMTMVRDASEPRWSAAINPDQANAWLAVRLVDTIVTHQGQDAWPGSIESIRIALQDDEMHVGARLKHASGSSVLWARVELEIDNTHQENELWAKLVSMHVGSTRVPKTVVALSSSLDLSSSRIRIGKGYIELGDGRVAKLIGLRVHKGRLEMVIETVASSDH
jgi:hypothetical protein